MSFASDLAPPRAGAAYGRVFVVTLPVLAYWLLNGLFLARLSPGVALTIDLAVVLGALLSILVLRRTLGVTAREVGLRQIEKASTRRLLEDSVVCTIVFGVAGWLTAGLAWQFLWKYDWVRTSHLAFSWQMVVDGSSFRLPVALYLAVTAGFFEELYFRGVLRLIVFSAYSGKYRAQLYSALSAVLFGLVHWESGLTAMIDAMVQGFLAARLFLWTRDLWPLVIAHSVCDFLLFF